MHDMVVVGRTQGFVVESTDGATLTDTDGGELMNLSSQLINVNLGHYRRDVLKAAKKQMGKLNFAFLLHGFANLPSIEHAQQV